MVSFGFHSGKEREAVQYYLSVPCHSLLFSYSLSPLFVFLIPILVWVITQAESQGTLSKSEMNIGIIENDYITQPRSQGFSLLCTERRKALGTRLHIPW